MNDLLKTATAELERFLSESLPKISDEWWTKHVIDRLSFQQQRLAQERRFTALRDLDFAALLRVLDQNWFELSSARSLPKEGRNWVKELQTVRNKWAHLSSHDVSSSEVYRDADTLGRMLAMIGASAAALETIEAFKANAVAVLASKAPAKAVAPPALHVPGSVYQAGADESPAIEPTTRNQTSALFAVGIHGLSVANKNELLFQNGINFNDLPLWQKRGFGVYWEEYDHPGENPITGEKVIVRRKRLHRDLELPVKDEYSTLLRNLVTRASESETK